MTTTNDFVPTTAAAAGTVPSPTGPAGAGARRLERISAHAARLFNDGLAAAGQGRFAAARDCFAAVVLWHPHDLEARSAYAFGCLSLGDDEEARRQWELVLSRRPRDERALRGLAMLEERRRAAHADVEPGGVGPGGVEPGGVESGGWTQARP